MGHYLQSKGTYLSELCVRALILALFVLSPCSARAATNETIYEKPISNRLNITGRAITMPVPLKDGTSELGDIIVRINPDDSIDVNKAALADKIRTTLDAPAQSLLEGLHAQDGFLTINALNSAGFDLQFDPHLQELVFHPSAEQRPVGDIALGGQRVPRISGNLAKPAYIAGYLNVYAGIDYAWDRAAVYSGSWGSGGAASARFDFDSAVRFGGLVLENKALYGSALGVESCPVIPPCAYGETSGFKRETSRLIYDMPDQSLRLEIGDVDPLGTSLQRATDLLGVSLEKSESKLNPGANIHPLGQSSFRIDRASDVDVLVNGAVLQRLHLPPGNYNVRDLPLTTGSNEVQLEISNDTGEKQILSFKTFFDSKLLAQGKSEWGVSAGAPSYFLNEERVYSSKQLMGTGFFRYGLSDQLTGLAHLQADQYVSMGGVGATRQTPWGIFDAGIAASGGELGFGGALDLNWALINFSGLLAEHKESILVSAEYRTTPDFHTPGEFVNSPANVLSSELNYALRLNASYSAPLGFETTGTLAGRLELANVDQLILGPNSPQDNRLWRRRNSVARVRPKDQRQLDARLFQ